MRQIWIMRHGDAPYLNGERQISEHGHQQIRQMTQWLNRRLKASGLQLETLLVSPILRAQQTADTFEETLSELADYSWRRDTEPLLKGEADPEMTISFVEQVTTGTTVLISHMPLVSNLWATWLKGESQYFPTAAMGSIALDSDGQAKKQLFQSPDQL